MMETRSRIATDDEILEAIREWSEDHGYAPTVRELGEMLGISSTSTIHTHLRRLRRQQKVDWVEGKTRTLHVKKRRPRRSREEQEAS